MLKFTPLYLFVFPFLLFQWFCRQNRRIPNYNLYLHIFNNLQLQHKIDVTLFAYCWWYGSLSQWWLEPQAICCLSMCHGNHTPTGVEFYSACILYIAIPYLNISDYNYLMILYHMLLCRCYNVRKLTLAAHIPHKLFSIQ